MGTPLMAWQQYVADVGLEELEDGSLAYREVIVSVMRQQGKTTLVFAGECARCLLWGRPQRIAYTAQTGKDARTKFKDDHLELLQRSPLWELVKRPYLSDGNTALVWKNMSRISVLDNTASAGHGRTLDMAVIDEAFADKDNTREQALLPTMATRADPQIWNTSTAGTLESTYLRRKVEIGRAAVQGGKTSGVAYFEWSVPEDEDPYDLSVISERMPAFGVTVDEPFILHAQETMTDGDYRRAIGNQWTETDERLIPAEWWLNVVDPQARVEEPVYAVDAKPDRTAAAVAKSDGTTIELVATRPGVLWVVDAFLENVPTGTTVVVDGNGPAAGVADELQGSGYNVRRFNSLEVRKACAAFFDGIADRLLKVRKDDRLDDAVKHAARRSTADSWAWHREAPGGELLVACSLAYASDPQVEVQVMIV